MVRRLTAVAELDARPEAGDAVRARADAGDEDSAWVLEQWRQGAVLLARVTVVAEAEDERGDTCMARSVIEDVWLERDAPPAVEEQVADVAPSELGELAAELRGRGVRVDDEQLAASYLHVELGARLRAALEER